VLWWRQVVNTSGLSWRLSVSRKPGFPFTISTPVVDVVAFQIRSAHPERTASNNRSRVVEVSDDRRANNKKSTRYPVVIT
ncbi:MAG: hypothetical protein ACRD72_24940, partial [Candidatus Angelobacter sp.]